jgi:hypothetical protein
MLRGRNQQQNIALRHLVQTFRGLKPLIKLDRRKIKPVLMPRINALSHLRLARPDQNIPPSGTQHLRQSRSPRARTYNPYRLHTASPDFFDFKPCLS